MNIPLTAAPSSIEVKLLDGKLQCPNCGGDYLHHGAVVVYTKMRHLRHSTSYSGGRHNTAPRTQNSETQARAEAES